MDKLLVDLDLLQNESGYAQSTLDFLGKEIQKLQTQAQSLKQYWNSPSEQVMVDRLKSYCDSMQILYREVLDFQRYITRACDSYAQAQAYTEKIINAAEGYD